MNQHDPSEPLQPPATLHSDDSMRIACLVCPGGRLETSLVNPVNPFTPLPFEYRVIVQPDRADTAGFLAVAMQCGACHTPYTLRIEADGRMTVRESSRTAACD